MKLEGPQPPKWIYWKKEQSYRITENQQQTKDLIELIHMMDGNLKECSN